MNSLEQCVDKLVMAGTDDWVYLAEAVRIVESTICGSAADIQRFTFELMREVTQQGLMELGDLNKEGFCRWRLPIEECLNRVEHEWNVLGRNPSLGEICWLQNTDKGNTLGEELFKKRDTGK